MSVTDPMLTLVGGFALLALNCAAYGAFAWDKACARQGHWRVPENLLLTLALLGGSIGAVLAQQQLRHKTRKQPFRTCLCLIIMGQTATVLASATPVEGSLPLLD